ncbi:MAG: HTH domain-containing protein [Bacteroidota bacterium]
MDYLTYSKRLDYLTEIIEKGHLQSPKELEEKFDCSEKTVRRMINSLRKRGVNVEYCRKLKKYKIGNNV